MVLENAIKSFPVIFTEEISSDDRFKLVEIPAELLPTFKSLCSSSVDEAEEKGLYIKGRPDDEAVLCSEDRTYALKSAQTSNCLLVSKLIKDSSSGSDRIEVIHTLNSVIETARITPRLHRVKELLLPSTYRGSTEKYLQKEKIKFYTPQELQAEVQASDHELNEMLQRLKVLTLDGFLRMVEAEHMYDTVSIILECTEAYSFSLEEISLDLLLEKLKDHEVSPTLISHVLYSVSDLLPNGCCKLIESEVCRVVGEKLLKSMTKPTTVFEFLRLWGRDLPDKFEPRMSYLEGLHYLDEDDPSGYKDRNYVHYLSAVDMPFDPKLRFKEIFAQKPRWTPNEIKPFVIDLIPSRDSNELNSFLLRFCRFITMKGTQFFSCKIKF